MPQYSMLTRRLVLFAAVVSLKSPYLPPLSFSRRL
jgi:hypothetical protein